VSQMLTPARPGRSTGDIPATAVTPVDFRRPSRIGRDAVLALESTHEAFARRLVTVWGTSTHAALEIEHLATEQLSIDDYVRTLPSPTLLATMRVGPLGATALLDVDLPLALILVERLLGGVGDLTQVSAARRPTDLEAGLIADELLTPAVGAVDEAFGDLEEEPSELLGVETTPQPLQLSAPGELLVLLTYRVELRGEQQAQGLLSLGYPVAPLLAQLDRLMAGTVEEDPERERASVQAITTALLEADLDVRVRLGGSTLPANALAGLSEGDVLRLDHAVTQPAELVCDGHAVGSAHLGRRGRRLAVQILQPPAARPADTSVTTIADRAARLYAGSAAPGTPLQEPTGAIPDAEPSPDLPSTPSDA
jgi:flagellar motor switch protein FliM